MRFFFDRRWILLAPAAALGVLGGVLAIDFYGHRQKPRSADAIVVLGAMVLRDGTASNALRERVEHAVSLYKSGLAPLLICTGGLGTHAPSEASVARALAIELGVPASQVLVEEKSHSTRQNALFAQEIARQHGVRSVIVVSQAYHLLRSRLLFHRAGLAATSSAVDGARVDKKLKQRARWTLREALLYARDVWY
jgi:uncharacterized SAM-binding protein YcdF (DUF218 family)